jgi:hypothetical protein
MQNHSIKISERQRRLWGMLIALISLTLVSTASAQTTSTSVSKGPSSSSAVVRKGEVVYVSGQELLVKMEDGSLKHFTVPQGATFTVDGKSYGVRDLTPGMKLTQRIVTTSTPQTITTVRSVTGKVWHVSAPSSVILTLPDGTNKQFKVPKNQKFTIDGQEKTVFDLRKGMTVTATAVSQVPETVVSTDRSVSGQPAPVSAPELPAAQSVGTLLVETAAAPTAAPAAANEPAPTKLPKTASPVPLVGLMGALAVLMALGLRARRKLLS